ncbi:hypothetical protein CARN8_4830002 [mine drainage metagenome]|uniref:Uncharacterized protein n=1 Tax=mine drainage metagenome TaxID=410659 RepID=A0A3P3ZQD4_9ZZZZ
MFGMIKVLLEIAAGGAGLWASYLWYKASTVQIDLGEGINSGCSQTQQSSWINATMMSVAESSELNAKAARWTAVAVMLGIVYNLFS